jgi:hypothetical protein
MAASTNITAVITGHELILLGNTKVGQEYNFGSLTSVSNPGWYGPWSFSTYTSRLISQTTLQTYNTCQNNTANPSTGSSLNK